MAQSLEEYAKEHGIIEVPEDVRELRREESDREELRQKREEAFKLMQSIPEQIREGIEPQFILYTAIKVIGGLSGDIEWMFGTAAQMDEIYADSCQQSLLNEASIEADRRLDVKAREYVRKTQMRLDTQYKQTERLLSDLTDALAALEHIKETCEN